MKPPHDDSAPIPTEASYYGAPPPAADDELEPAVNGHAEAAAAPPVRRGNGMADPRRSLTLAAPAPPYRTPPHSTESEQALLGALLVNNAVYERISDFLRPQHFYNPVHQRIYAALQHKIDSGQLADPATLRPLFENDPALTDLGGGARYLGNLAASVITIINSWSYAQTIVEYAKRRELIEIGTAMVNDAYEDESLDGSANAIADRAQEQLLEASIDGATAADEPITLHDAMVLAQEEAERAAKIGGPSGILTGIRSLDQKLGALGNDYLIVGARPGMGKTALIRQIFSEAAAAGEPVLFVSLDENRNAIGRNEIAARADITVEDQRNGKVDMIAMRAIGDAIRAAKDLPFEILDKGGIGIAEIRRAARRMKRKYGRVGIIAVDHLQITQNNRDKGENRRLELEALSRGLKALRTEIGCCVIGLSQLSRNVEAREDKRPTLADLRETGALEQDADIVLLLYREAYYLGNRPPEKGINEPDEVYSKRSNAFWDRYTIVKDLAEINVEKCKFGPPSRLKVKFDGARMRFSDLAGTR